jgi:hypothetical protein
MKDRASENRTGKPADGTAMLYPGPTCGGSGGVVEGVGGA